LTYGKEYNMLTNGIIMEDRSAPALQLTGEKNLAKKPLLKTLDLIYRIEIMD
jgi:hypothetical protein